MPQEGQSGKSQGSDEFQPARRLAASVAPAPPRRLTSELQLDLPRCAGVWSLCLFQVGLCRTNYGRDILVGCLFWK